MADFTIKVRQPILITSKPAWSYYNQEWNVKQEATDVIT